MSVAPTPSQTIGPFFAPAMAWCAGADLVVPDFPGALEIAGRVLDGAGAAVPDAMVEIHQQPPAARPAPPAWRGFGRSLTDDAGRYRFVTAKPAPDGRQAPHLDVSVFARGLLQRLVTRMYFPDEAEANAADPLLGAVGDPDRVATLVAVPDAGGLRFDIRLQGESETVFLAW